MVRGKASGTPVALVTTRTIPIKDHVPSGPPMEISSFQMETGKLFLLDVRSQQAYRYGVDGTMDLLVGRPGQGPGKYKLPGGFCVSGGRLPLLSAGKKYVLYDLEGEHLKTIPVIYPGGIPNKVYAGPEGTAFFTVCSRYAPEASIYQVNADGMLIRQFSPPDEAFASFWDMVHPMGNLVVMEDRIAQMFIHKYEILFFSLEGNPLEAVTLASDIYIQPDYQKAKNIAQKRKAMKAFMESHSLINGFFRCGDTFVTVLKNTRLETGGEVMELWGRDFWGKGRVPMPTDEKLVGTTDHDLVFYNENTFTLIFRNIGETVAAANEKR